MDQPATRASNYRPYVLPRGKWTKNRRNRPYGENHVNHILRPFDQSHRRTNMLENFHPRRNFAPVQHPKQEIPFGMRISENGLKNHIKYDQSRIESIQELRGFNPQMKCNMPILPVDGRTDYLRRDNSPGRKNIPDFADPKTLKIRHQATITSLYTGSQCSNCGMRFAEGDKSRYAQHLDWHFRQNHNRKKTINHCGRRKWYYSLSDWKTFEELEDLETREMNYFETQKIEDAGADTKVSYTQAHPTKVSENCDICGDPFICFYNDEEEMWQLKNAMRINDKPYHPVCFEDYARREINEESQDDATEDNRMKQETEETTEEIRDPFPKVGDDDGILNEVDPIIIVIDDDDDDPTS